MSRDVFPTTVIEHLMCILIDEPYDSDAALRAAFKPTPAAIRVARILGGHGRFLDAPTTRTVDNEYGHQDAPLPDMRVAVLPRRASTSRR